MFQIRRTAQIGFSAFIRCEKREDASLCRYLREGRSGIRRVESDRVDEHGTRPYYSPAMVMPSMRSVGEATEPRKIRSLPMAVMFRNISFRLPATVTC